MNIINTDKAPKAIGPYSQAIRHNNLMFTSGQIPINPDTGLIVSEDFKDQVYQCLKNIKGILEEENLSLNCIIKLTVYVTDLDNFSKLNETFEPCLTQTHHISQKFRNWRSISHFLTTTSPNRIRKFWTFKRKWISQTVNWMSSENISNQELFPQVPQMRNRLITKANRNRRSKAPYDFNMQ